MLAFVCLAGRQWCEGGLSAGDLVVALDGLRVSTANLEGLLVRCQVSDSVTLHPLPRDEIMAFSVLPTAQRNPSPLVKKHQGNARDPEFGVARKCEESVSPVVKPGPLRMLDYA